MLIVKTDNTQPPLTTGRVILHTLSSKIKPMITKTNPFCVFLFSAEITHKRLSCPLGVFGFACLSKLVTIGWVVCLWSQYSFVCLQHNDKMLFPYIGTVAKVEPLLFFSPWNLLSAGYSLMLTMLTRAHENSSSGSRVWCGTRQKTMFINKQGRRNGMFSFLYLQLGQWDTQLWRKFYNGDGINRTAVSNWK